MLPDGSGIKKLLEGKPGHEAYQNRGRLPTRWSDDIKRIQHNWMIKTGSNGCPAVDWKQLLMIGLTKIIYFALEAIIFCHVLFSFIFLEYLISYQTLVTTWENASPSCYAARTSAFCPFLVNHVSCLSL